MAVSGFQPRPLTKGYNDDESTSREERIEVDKLSVLPSLPENLKVTVSTNLGKYSCSLWEFHRRDFGLLIKHKCY